MWQSWLRLVGPLEQTLQRRPFVVALAIFEVSLLLVASLPFVLYEQFGPERFDEDLVLGTVPLVEEPTPLPVPTASTSAVPFAAQPEDGVDRLHPDIPLDLGPNVRVTLLFSVGSRAVTRDDAERLNINDPGRRGDDGLTDVVMLVIADPDSGRVALLSIPRDYYVQSRGARINATWVNGGTQALVDDVGQITGLPINHVALVNFTAFADLVDELGGVAMRTDRELADLESVLYVPDAGCWSFDGAEALAWARSRNTLTQASSGRWVRDVTASDFGRIGRQQQLLAAAFDQLRGPRALTKVPGLLGVARSGLIVDEGLDLQAVRELVAAFLDVQAGSFEGFTIPSNNRRIDGAVVLVPDQDGSRPIIERLRAWPPSTPLDVTVDASPPDSTLGEIGDVAVDEDCTVANAMSLPSPFQPLAGVAASRPAPRPTPTATPDRPSDDQSGTEDASPSESPTTEEPSDDAEPTDEPSGEPTTTEEPAPSESESVAPEPTSPATPPPSSSPTPTDASTDDGEVLP